MLWHSGALLVLCASGCAQPPDIPPSPDLFLDGGTTGYADHVIAFSMNGQLMTCSDNGAACDSPPPPCGANAVIGPPDNMFFTLGPGDKVESAFLCSVVIEHADA